MTKLHSNQTIISQKEFGTHLMKCESCRKMFSKIIGHIENES